MPPMTRDEIDDMLDAMAKEAAAKGDEAFLPGVISFNAATWIKTPSTGFPTTCVSVGVGIRYRGVQVLISSARENKVLNRAEDGGEGAPYCDLEPKLQAA